MLLEAANQFSFFITLFIITYYLCILYFWMFEGPKEDGQMVIGFTLFKLRFYYYYYYSFISNLT